MDPLYDAHGGPIYRAMAAHCSRFALQPLLAMRSCTRAVCRLRPTACIMRLQQHNLSVRRFRAPRAGDLWCQVPISLNSFQFLDAVWEKNTAKRTNVRPADARKLLHLYHKNSSSLLWFALVVIDKPRKWGNYMQCRNNLNALWEERGPESVTMQSGFKCTIQFLPWNVPRGCSDCSGGIIVCSGHR